MMQNIATWWTLPTSSLFDWAVVIIILVPTSIVAGRFGHWVGVKYKGDK